jgi:hypothetical protein
MCGNHRLIDHEAKSVVCILVIVEVPTYCQLPTQSIV